MNQKQTGTANANPKPTPEEQQFAAYLLAARTLWRSHRELVEASEFPTQHRAALDQAGLPAQVNSSEYHSPSEERKAA